MELTTIARTPIVTCFIRPHFAGNVGCLLCHIARAMARCAELDARIKAIHAASVANFSSCLHGGPSCLPNAARCCCNFASGSEEEADACASSSRSLILLTDI